MRLGLLALISLAVPATAGDFSLIAPVACDLNGPCYIQQYVDHDDTSGASDFTCSGLSYNGHKGTDFALPDHAMIDQGVDVLAAAAGTVTGLRDDMPDVRHTTANNGQTEGRECGNGIVIRHSGGWETQYCHMRRGSISVTNGQQVAAGDVLGQVGMSGRAAFPHLHLSVRHDGAVIDPFDPDGTVTCGAPDPNPLWSIPLAYRAGGIISIGTSTTIPDYDAIRAGTVPPATSTGDALAIYAFMFGTQAGDVIRMALQGPDGTVIKQDTDLSRPQAQSFRAIGKKRRSARWPQGDYSGIATLLRGGSAIDSASLDFTLP